MKKELIGIIVILGFIYGIIYIFSIYNEKKYSARRQNSKTNQTATANLLARIAQANNINWSEDDFKSNLVGIKYDKWKEYSKCLNKFKDNNLQLLQCFGKKMCKFEIDRGCLLETEAMLKSPEPTRKNKAILLLEKKCKEDNPLACLKLVRWQKQQNKKSGKQSKKLAYYQKLACFHGLFSFCSKVEKSLFLENCVLENTKDCLNNQDSVSDPVSHYFACKLGKNDSCRKFITTLLGPNSFNFAFFLEACIQQDSSACSKIAEFTSNQNMHIYACNLGSSSSCQNLLSQTNTPLALKIYINHENCRKGNIPSCKKLKKLENKLNLTGFNF
ncbi:MAG: hypothetical protein ACQES9_00875 [Myxococcota bacterium]